MLRIALVGGAVALLLAASADAAPNLRREQKHSGVIVAVAPAAGTITVEEMGPWTGTKTAPARRTFHLSPTTRIDLDSRSAQGAGGWPGGFTQTPLSANALRPGDFVTVTTEQSHGTLAASSADVVRPAAAR